MGVVLSCLLVCCASSRAITKPAIVTRRAASLRRGGMDITGVLGRVMFEVMIRPATMLPQASRLIGPITRAVFSLIGDRVLKRG